MKGLMATNIHLPKELLYELRPIAIEEGQSMSQFIRGVLLDYHTNKRS
jgi:hypothetical protein